MLICNTNLKQLHLLHNSIPHPKTKDNTDDAFFQSMMTNNNESKKNSQKNKKNTTTTTLDLIDCEVMLGLRQSQAGGAFDVRWVDETEGIRIVKEKNWLAWNESNGSNVNNDGDRDGDDGNAMKSKIKKEIYEENLKTQNSLSKYISDVNVKNMNYIKQFLTAYIEYNLITNQDQMDSAIEFITRHLNQTNANHTAGTVNNASNAGNAGNAQRTCPAGHALVKGANVEQYKKLTIEQCGGVFPGAGCNYCNSMSTMEDLPNMWSCSEGCQVDVCTACSTKFGWEEEQKTVAEDSSMENELNENELKYYLFEMNHGKEFDSAIGLTTCSSSMKCKSMNDTISKNKELLMEVINKHQTNTKNVDTDVALTSVNKYFGGTMTNKIQKLLISDELNNNNAIQMNQQNGMVKYIQPGAALNALPASKGENESNSESNPQSDTESGLVVTSGVGVHREEDDKEKNNIKEENEDKNKKKEKEKSDIKEDDARLRLWMNMNVYKSEKEHQRLTKYRTSAKTYKPTTNVDIINNKYDISVLNVDAETLKLIPNKNDLLKMTVDEYLLNVEADRIVLE